MAIHGFTLLRNGLKYDYPFRESLSTLQGLCESTFVALGDSSDGSGEALAEFPRVKIIPTVWNENLRKGGVILSQQTNIALSALRDTVKDAGTWAIYLQADEVLLESEFELIRRDLRLAQEGGYDAVRFRYLHFWLDYDRIAVGRRWYPQEIRAIRLRNHRGELIESFGDAQSFRGAMKIYESDAHVYHYGHVREKAAYELKKKDFHRWWHSDGEIGRILKRARAQESREETLRFLGSHPEAMRERIRRHGAPEPALAEKVTVVTGEIRVAPGVDTEILARERTWVRDLSEVPPPDRAGAIVLEPSLWQRLRGRSAPPRAMRSPQARPWTPEFRAKLALWQAGVFTR